MPYGTKPSNKGYDIFLVVTKYKIYAEVPNEILRILAGEAEEDTEHGYHAKEDWIVEVTHDVDR